MYQIWGLYIILEVRNAEKWLWPIFDSKVGESVPIGMKLELNVWHYLLNVYTIIQIDISKHVETSSKNYAKSKTSKHNRQNSENTIFAKNWTYVEQDTTGHLRTNFEEFTLICKARIAKNWVRSNFGCKLGQSDPIVMKLKLDMSCYLLNVYTKFQIDISKHVEKKSPENSDGRPDGQTDGRTSPRHNTSVFQTGV